MKKYTVRYEIEVDADSAAEAAELAKTIIQEQLFMQNESFSPIFEVAEIDDDGENGDFEEFEL